MIHVVICSPLPALRAGLRALAAGDPDLSVDAALGSFDALNSHPSEAFLSETGVFIITPGALDENNLAWLAARSAWAVLLVGDDVNATQMLIRAIAPPRAWGVLSPEATPEALQTAVRALSDGLIVVSPEMLDGLLQMPQTEPEQSQVRAGLNITGIQAEIDEEPPQHLTDRETDVLRLAAQGMTNKQIAYTLGISEHTVKFHISAIYGKLGVSNRAEAVRKGARWGWVPL